MLRITADDRPRVVTFRLEGRLEGPWAVELEKCWRSTLAALSKPEVRVDLTEVTFIDAAGKARLAAMHAHGAVLVASDCLTKAVINEITGARSSV